MPRLTELSLEFAKTHIASFWDSDFFPKPFEFDAIWHDWNGFKRQILNTDIERLPVHQPKLCCAPKPSGALRVVHQLDPLASIAYTALAYMFADQVERRRATVTSKIACSYRFAPDLATGTLFRNGSGFDDFISQSRTLAASSSHVLVADITDFFNQIYVHRLRNNLCNAAPDLSEFADATEGFLKFLNGSATKGIPVGPAASIVMSETVMIDIDQFITDEGFQHTRYVDDIRIFSQDPVRLWHMHERLARYLYENHRLTLSSEKTKLLSSQSFVAEFLDDHEELEKREVHQALQRIRSARDDYALVASATTESTVRPSVLRDMLRLVLSKERVDLGLARHVLRRAREYRIRTILPQVFERLEFFGPVMSDVVMYLNAVTNQRVITDYKDALAHKLNNEACFQLEYLRIWIERYITDQPGFLEHQLIRHYLDSSPLLEFKVKDAIRTRSVSSFRSQRMRYSAASDWDKRQIIRLSLATAVDERTAWLSELEPRCTTPVELACIRWVRGTS